MKRPSFQFYPGDWLRDPALRACSIAARGLWMDMICIMHEGTPYGHLTLNQKDILPPILARILGVSLSEIEGLLLELEDVGVFSRTESGCIYSRRMIEDERIRQARASGGYAALNNPNVPKSKKKEGYPSRVSLRGSLGGSPSSSSSSSSSEEKRATSQSDDALSRGTSPRSRASQIPDEEWLKELQAKPAYQALDVVQILSKAEAWCEVKGKQLTRARFINWLNREDKPIQLAANGNGSAGHSGSAGKKPEFCSTCGGATVVTQLDNGRVVGMTPCGDCHGSGRKIA